MDVTRAARIQSVWIIAGTCMLSLWAGTAQAGDGTSSADTAWVLTASALVLLMTLPGLALFYGGLVRARNVLSVMMHCFSICSLASVLWVVCGYSLAFGHGNDWLGTLDKAWFRNLMPMMETAPIPENAFALFQMTFAIITPALIVGAFAERIGFAFLTLFSAAWLMIVYVPVAHWVWGGGYFGARGALDFAGGIVVHTTAGISALICAALVGPRSGFPRHTQPPHSPGFTMIGAGLLWVGWFGFNGGSALHADGNAAGAIIATHLSASTAAITWSIIEWLRIGKPTSVGIVTGAVAGLATITPASGFVSPGAALIFGLVASLVCFPATLMVKQYWKVDDTLDVFAVHGIGGMVGSILLGVFAAPALGGAGFGAGLDLSGQIVMQIFAVATVAVWSGLATFVLVRILRRVVGLRVTDEQEYQGLDITAHGERAYDLT